MNKKSKNPFKEKNSLSEEEIILLKRCLDSKNKLISVTGEKERLICESLSKKGILRMVCSDGGLFLKQKDKEASEKSYYSEVFYRLQREPDNINYESDLSNKRWVLYDILRNRSNSKIAYLDNHLLKTKINKLGESDINKLLKRAASKLIHKDFQLFTDLI